MVRRTMGARAQVEYRQNRQGRIEKIVEAYANEHELGTAKAMLTLWLSPPPKGEGLDTYTVADRLGCTHQGVSYLAKKYGIELGGRSQVAFVLARVRKMRKGYTSLEDYFKATEEKTIKEQAEELGIGETTVKRYRRLHRRGNKK
jgi:hypothetical protein